jgi:hypothetical protein
LILVKSPLALLFLLIVLLKSIMPAMDTSELSKLGALAEHYAEHQNENPGLSFWQFLMLHYENPKHHTEDHQKHSTLPYGEQHHDSCPLQVWFACTEFTLQLNSGNVHSEISNLYNNPTGSNFLSSIWQPPRKLA